MRILYMFNVRNYIRGRWSWKSNVGLEKSFKMVAVFCMNPAISVCLSVRLRPL